MQAVANQQEARRDGLPIWFNQSPSNTPYQVFRTLLLPLLWYCMAALDAHSCTWNTDHMFDIQATAPRSAPKGSRGQAMAAAAANEANVTGVAHPTTQCVLVYLASAFSTHSRTAEGDSSCSSSNPWTQKVKLLSLTNVVGLQMGDLVACMATCREMAHSTPLALRLSEVRQSTAMFKLSPNGLVVLFLHQGCGHGCRPLSRVCTYLFQRFLSCLAGPSGPQLRSGG